MVEIANGEPDREHTSIKDFCAAHTFVVSHATIKNQLHQALGDGAAAVQFQLKSGGSVFARFMTQQQQMESLKMRVQNMYVCERSERKEGERSERKARKRSERKEGERSERK